MRKYTLAKAIPNKNPNENKRLVGIARSESFSGPIPPPQILEYYERILPGSGNRIIKMAEDQLYHRTSLEKLVISSDVNNEKKGMNYAFISLILMMVIGVALIFTGKEAGYLALFGPPIAQLVNYFFVKREAKGKILDKDKEIPKEKKKLESKLKRR